ncbi:MAG: hypothetical protein RLZZ461_287 [Planctomycetota bacterium]
MTTTASAQPDITIEPAAAACRMPRSIATLSSDVAQWRRDTLDELEIDPAAIVIATGHQAAIWHPGILAKDLVVRGLTDRLTATGEPAVPLHVVADHDANDGGLVRLPTIAEDGRLESIGWRLRPSPDGRGLRDRPAGRAAAAPPCRLPIAGLAERIEAIHAAVDAHADAPSLAMQLGLAAADLARPVTGEIPRRSMSSLLQAAVGRAILDRMASDPEACIAAHDAAVEADRTRRTINGRSPRGVARLLDRGHAKELPLWRDTKDGRRPVLLGESLDAASLRPRALLATALARLGGCDLFVHGLGGGVYDLVMEDWLARWLGDEIAASLAPAIVATATLRLPLPIERIDDPMTPEAWHRLRNDPDLASLGEPTRSAHLAAINAAPRRSPERRAAYLSLRAAIAEAHRRGAVMLADAERRLSTERCIARSNAIAHDRTWSFALHDDTSLAALATDIGHALAAV